MEHLTIQEHQKSYYARPETLPLGTYFTLETHAELQDLGREARNAQEIVLYIAIGEHCTSITALAEKRWPEDGPNSSPNSKALTANVCKRRQNALIQALLTLPQLIYLFLVPRVEPRLRQITCSITKKHLRSYILILVFWACSGLGAQEIRCSARDQICV